MIRLQDLEQFSQDDVEAAILRNEPDELKLVPVTVALAFPNHNFAEAVCVRLFSHYDPKVRGNSLISLGHLARQFHVLDESVVKPLIERGLCDEDEYVRVHAKSAADEIHQFLHWQIEGHVYG